MIPFLIRPRALAEKMRRAVLLARARTEGLTPLTRDELSRIESLGDNCEIGAVLALLGYHHGGLFKWANNPPDALLKALMDDLRNLYRFENLTPFTRSMVKDNAYGVAFHSGMNSKAGAFAKSDEARRVVHCGEIGKIQHLRARFMHRAAMGGAVFVIKRNVGLAPALLDAIERELLRLGGGKRFALLEVRVANTRHLPGTVDRLSELRFAGYVRGFADYERAMSVNDLTGWARILKWVLQASPAPHWDRTAVEDTSQGEMFVSIR
jgi:ribosomal protein S18 acetylase RimI-like enzyme